MAAKLGRTHRPVVKRAEDCTHCRMCLLMCPDLAITMPDKESPVVIDLDYCKGCSICAAVCPKDVIEMEMED